MFPAFAATDREFHGRTGSILFRASASDGTLTVDPYEIERGGTLMIEKARPEFTEAIHDALLQIVDGPALPRARRVIVAGQEGIVSESFRVLMDR